MIKSLSKLYIISSVILGFILYTSVLIAQEKDPVQKTINIGIYAPFTSESAYIGRNMLGAMELARDQLKSSEINYQFYTLDELPANQHAALTLQKFIDTHHINVLLTEGAKAGTMAAPLAKKNNLIHFCLGCTALADGKNNFQTHSPNHKRGEVLTKSIKPEFVAQFKQEYFSHPVTEAGYAYDIFHLINNSAQIAMKTDANYFSQAIAANLLAKNSGTGLMGSYTVNEHGVSYKKERLV